MASKVIGYVRVSTDKQAESGLSLEAQKEKLRQYSDLYGLELVDILVDAGESAGTLERVQLKAALRMLGVEGIDGMLILKLDRLTRSVADLNTLIERYFKKHSLVSVEDRLDTGSAAGRLVMNVLASVSQWEREAVAERTKAAMGQKKKRGEYTGGHTPYGYYLMDGKLYQRQDEQMTIEIVRELRLQGVEYRWIAEQLYHQGRRSRAGKKFSMTQLRRMIEKS